MTKMIKLLKNFLKEGKLTIIVTCRAEYITSYVDRLHLNPYGQKQLPDKD